MERTTFEVTDERRQLTARASQDDVFPRTTDEVRYRFARSNGVAAGQTWTAARDAARLELIERDRVLAAWYGELTPRRVAFEPAAIFAGIREHYELGAYAFDFDVDARAKTSPRVRGVFAFPRDPKNPLSYGFGAGLTATDALASAARECVQRLAFLWGEQITFEEPSFAPTPEFHQEFFLRPCMHSVLHAWLSGDHAREPVLLSRPPSQRGHRFVDLTPRELSTRVAVVRALPSSELPLVFGKGHPALAGEIVPRFAIHPIA
jgi:ribosomal protein S12 methylthiotransferase accessory factor YcaO